MKAFDRLYESSKKAVPRSSVAAEVELHKHQKDLLQKSSQIVGKEEKSAKKKHG